MAIVANTFLTYSSIGNREDLTDLIKNISPTKTPFMSAIGTGSASAVLHEWQTQALAAAATNAQVEGDEYAFTAVTPTVRVTNTCQIMAKKIIVSGTQDVVSKAGRREEMAYQIGQIAGPELARDMEYGILNNTAAVTGNSTTARQLKGAIGWVTTNTTANSAAALDEDDVEGTASDVWVEGGEANLIICNAFNKRKISSFTTGVTKNLDADANKLVKNVDVYETDFGMMRVVPDHFCAADDVYLFDTDLWEIDYLRRTTVDKVAKTGDATKRVLINEFTLKCKQEKGNGNITGTSTS